MNKTGKMLAPIKITPTQQRWLLAETKRTGNGFAVIIRGLLQEKVDQK